MLFLMGPGYQIEANGQAMDFGERNGEGGPTGR
jgi:hypothetical protein